jgi:hypothetical protein
VSLYATPRDVGRFVQAFVRPNPVLGQETLKQMLQPQRGTAGSWGLGPTLFVANGAGGHVVGHDGGMPPASGTVMRVNPATGNGIVMTISGARVSVSRLAHDWVCWETGQVTPDARLQVVQDRAVPAAVTIVVGGIVLLLWRLWRPA